ncbi:MAG: hypothetical protein WAU04_10765 [Candidatus Nitrotoga sp.]
MSAEKTLMNFIQQAKSQIYEIDVLNVKSVMVAFQLGKLLSYQ